MTELVVCAKVRQDGADPAMNRHTFRLLDDESERLGVDHFTLAQYSEAGE